MNESIPMHRASWLAARSWRFWIMALPALYAASIVPAWFLMVFLLKMRVINEGGQLLFGLFFYPIVRMLGW